MLEKGTGVGGRGWADQPKEHGLSLPFLSSLESHRDSPPPVHTPRVSWSCGCCKIQALLFTYAKA